MKTWFLLWMGLVTISFGTLVQANTKACIALLSRENNAVAATENFIGYLSMLLENHIVSTSELNHFTGQLENGRLINPISEHDSYIDSIKQIHHEGLANLIQTEKLDHKHILRWANTKFNETKRVVVQQEVVKNETHDIRSKIQFGRIEPGGFLFGKQRGTVILTHAFELMTTHITQDQWVRYMGENPSYNIDGDATITKKVGGKFIKMQPDHPVEQITWWSAIVFANKLSEAHGLKPVYDISRIKFNPATKAENGTLDVDGITDQDLRINAPDGKGIYT
jgi:formylglycine-generating enzyme required for sulfatase activity